MVVLLFCPEKMSEIEGIRLFVPLDRDIFEAFCEREMKKEQRREF
jgi:hypothetical protein